MPADALSHCPLAWQFGGRKRSSWTRAAKWYIASSLTLTEFTLPTIYVGCSHRSGTWLPIAVQLVWTFFLHNLSRKPKTDGNNGGLTALDQEVLVGQANKCQSMLSPYEAATNTDQASHMRWPERPIETVCLANTPVSGASAVVNTASAHRLHRSW